MEDEDITDEMGQSSKKKLSKSATSLSSATSASKPLSIISRTTSEYDTCAPEKSVEFDPVQGNT